MTKQMEIKTYYGDWDPKLNVGLIWECEEDKDFGVVVGYRIEKISASVSCKDFGPKLYYFKKDKSVVKYRYDIVIFLLTKEYELEVTEVLDISEYKLVFPTSKNYSPSRRADGICHHDSVWEEIEKGVPIIETGDLKKMHLPKIISTDSQGLPSRIELYEGLAIENQELLINSYLDYKKHGGGEWPTNDQIKSKVKEIIEYVNSLDSEKIIHTYCVGRAGYLVKRAGRDDHFHMTNYKTIQTRDKYIHSLVELLHEENYCLGSNADEDYDIIDKDLTDAGIKSALSKYSKEDHVAYLIADYYNGIENDLFYAECYQNQKPFYYNTRCIENEIKISIGRNARSMTFTFNEECKKWTLERYKVFISQFNQKKWPQYSW